MALATALTLADYARQSNDVAQMKIVMSLLENGSILDDLPLVTNPSLTIKGRRITNADLPATGWGKINQNPTGIKTSTRDYEEQAALIREIIQVDRKLLAQRNWIDDPFQVQIDGAMKSHMYEMNDTFFNNDPGAAGGIEDAWIGLRPRLRNPGLYGVEPNLRIDCGGVVMTQSMSQANANSFLEYLAQGLAYLGASDGRGCVAYTNWLLKERMARAYRTANGASMFTTQKDDFGRMADFYRQMKITDIGWKRDGTSLIFPTTENASGVDTGSGDRTSLVIARFGTNYLKGWQDSELKPEYLGRSTEQGVYENVLIDWGCGLCYPNSRSFVELYNIKIA